MTTMWQAVQVSPLVRRRILESGTHCTLVRVELAAEGRVPLHAHPHEQISYVASGRVTLTRDGVDHDLRAGDALVIPGGITHGVFAREETVVLETFSPPRDDLLATDIRVG